MLRAVMFLAGLVLVVVGVYLGAGLAPALVLAGMFFAGVAYLDERAAARRSKAAKR